MRRARAAFVSVGIALAAAGGAIAYRDAFVEPRTAVLISEEGVREVRNTPLVGGWVAPLPARRGPLRLRRAPPRARRA